jgi:hypothetical protein
LFSCCWLVRTLTLFLSFAAHSRSSSLSPTPRLLPRNSNIKKKVKIAETQGSMEEEE